MNMEELKGSTVHYCCSPDVRGCAHKMHTVNLIFDASERRKAVKGFNHCEQVDSPPDA